MKYLAVGSLLLALGASALAAPTSKCFQLEALQGNRTVTLNQDGDKVSGVFAVASDDEADARSYKFTGTRTGDTLHIKFDDGKMPDVAPSELKSLDWTLAQSSGKETLRIKFHGKNYETNQYEDYVAEFEPCAP